MPTTQLAILESTDMSTVAEQLEQLTRQTQKNIEDSKADNTKKAYASDWAQFEMFCSYFGFSPMPAAAETVARYVTFMDMQKRKVATIQRHLASIAVAHKAKDYESPTKSTIVHSALRGMRKNHGEPQVQKDALLIEDIRRIVRVLPNDRRGVRDRALLLIGFAGAFRRSELAAIDMRHVEVTRNGLVILLPRSKTDQDGKGRKVAIPYGSNPETCPVRAFEDWIAESGIQSGFVFRPINKSGRLQDSHNDDGEDNPKPLTGKTIARIVKKYARELGLDPKRFAGHSLRAGLATSAAQAGVSRHAIQKQTGHKSNVVDRYIRDGDLFRENAAAKVGL